MIIPTVAIAPLFIVSFVMLGYQYWRVNSPRRLLNLQFSLMLGAIVLMLIRILLPDWLDQRSLISMVLFALALLWLGLTLVLFRFLPPPRF